jgi:hypothetical protein
MIFLKSKLDKEFIKYCYEKDSNLIDNFHQKSGEGLDSCVDDEYKLIVDNNIQITKIYDFNDSIVGYFGKEADNILTSYFICPSFRKDPELWNKIFDLFEKPTYTRVYMKNIPAFKFLRKNNFEIQQFSKLNNQLTCLMVRR